MWQAADFADGHKNLLPAFAQLCRNQAKPAASNRQAGKLNCTMKVEKHRAAIEAKESFTQQEI